jgi:hypothetical protein
MGEWWITPGSRKRIADAAKSNAEKNIIANLQGSPKKITISASLYPEAQGNALVLTKIADDEATLYFDKGTLVPNQGSSNANKEQTLLNLLGTNPTPLSNWESPKSDNSTISSNTSTTAAPADDAALSPAGAPAGPTTGDAAASNEPTPNMFGNISKFFRGGRNMRRTRGGRRRTQNKKKQYRRSKKYRY